MFGVLAAADDQMAVAASTADLAVLLVDAAPVFLEAYMDTQDAGSLLLVDRRTGDTVGAGMVRRPTGRPDVVPQDYAIDRTARQVVWLTGLARRRQVHGRGRAGAQAARPGRAALCAGRGRRARRAEPRSRLHLGGPRRERPTRRRDGRHLLDAGMTVIVALVSPFRADRAAARNLFAPGDFVEVGQSYEPPEAAEVVLDGTGPSTGSRTPGQHRHRLTVDGGPGRVTTGRSPDSA